MSVRNQRSHRSQKSIPIMYLTQGMRYRVDANCTSSVGSGYDPLTIPVWDSKDEVVAGIAPSENGLQAEIRAYEVGETFITCTIDGHETKMYVIVEEATIGEIQIVPSLI